MTHARAFLFFLFTLALPPAARAGGVTQTFTLRPGWNSLWIEVTPENNNTGVVFQGIPVKSIWRFNDDGSSVRYILDTTQLMPDKDGWMTWVPPVGAAQVINTLLKVHGGHAYMVELDGAANVNLSITGTPVVKPLAWISGRYTITGLPVDPAAALTFASFLSGSTAHTGQDIRRLQANGTWATIPSSTVITRGESYWIFTNATSGLTSWQGPVGVEVDNRGLLNYGESVVEQAVTLANNTAASLTFSLNMFAAGGAAGPVALSLWRDGSERLVNGSQFYGWEAFTGTKTITVLSKTKKIVRLAIRRADMTGQGAGSPFESVLRITGGGVRGDLAVRADGFVAGAGGGGAASRYAGLWVGSATITGVNEPASAQPDAIQPAAQPAQLRVLVRVDANGQASLLREATVLWLDGLSGADGSVTEGGKFIVAATDSELQALESTWGTVGSGRLKGSLVKDGKTVPRRISSVGFSHATPVTLAGTIGSSLNGTVVIPYNDDLNPYKHRYHPDHDNKNPQYTATLPEGQESFTVNRQITLTFSAIDPENSAASGWGDSMLGGAYAETINGLHRNAVKAGGTFRLVRTVQTTD